MRIEIPEFALVALVGATSSGKSSFAQKHFLPTEALSSDLFRAMLSDDQNDQSATGDAFDLLFYAAGKRLDRMKTTVIDATNVQQKARKRILALAREQNVHAVAIVLDLPEKELLARNASNPERGYPAHVIHKQVSELKRSVKFLRREGFRFVYVLGSQAEIDAAEIVRTKLWTNKKDEHGPFDIIGDIHGCFDELMLLLDRLGYVRDATCGMLHPSGRMAVFLGDLCDRGPRNMDTLRLVMKMEQSGAALAVPGNHDAKLVKYLRSKDVHMTHGLAVTVAELAAESESFRAEAADFLDGLISHYVLDDGKLVVSHAGLKEAYMGRASAAIRTFCLYGEVTGETDEYGLPVRMNWASDYRGKAAVVFGHVPQHDVQVLNNTYCIDTGCVFGGKLTAYRYPEGEIVSVDALAQYYVPVKPLVQEAPRDDMLSIGDVQGELHIATSLMRSVTIRESNTAAALESMSRFAADPRWLLYLPPTMSPCETSPLEDYLEHPLEAFNYYRSRGMRHVVCEKKHMGSRAVIVLCHGAETAKNRFGVSDGSTGIVYTRTGRRFFDDAQTEREILDRLDKTLTVNGFWEDLATDWVCLDTELMPWSEKAQALLSRQYAPVGRAGRNGLAAATAALEQTILRTPDSPQAISERDVSLDGLLTRFTAKAEAVGSYVDAYRAYCWRVDSVDDLRIAPFHLLACEGRVFSDEKHTWHMDTLKRYCTGTDPIFIPTEYICVDTAEQSSVEAGVNWWVKLTGAGGEGMVVKPETFVARRQDELIQPAIKCRGPEYLRIIYGPEYCMPEHLERLKNRSLARKRSLALKEFALGMEALTRFVQREPLYRVHACVFGILALESEPVDPRL